MKYGAWTTVGGVPTSHDKNKHITVFVRCVCGKEKYVERYTLTSGLSKSCGCVQIKRLHEEHRMRPYESLFRGFVKTCSRRKSKPSVDMSYEEFLEFCKETECHYCGFPITWSMYNYNSKGHSGAYNLDRKDNEKGYSVENCVVCCARCNWGKGDGFTYEEWVVMTAALRRFICQQLALSAYM